MILQGDVSGAGKKVIRWGNVDIARIVLCAAKKAKLQRIDLS